MTIYTIEIAGRAIMAFSAIDRDEAEAFVEDGEESSAAEVLFSVINPDGTPVWNGTDALHVRKAEVEERAQWDRQVVGAIVEGEVADREEALSDGYVAFLIPVAEP